MPDLDDDMPEPTSGGSGGKIAAAAVLAFLVGGGAGYAGTTLIPSSEASEEEQSEHAGGEDGVGGRDVMALEPFIVNLRGSGGGRVLRMEVQLEHDLADTERVERGVPAMRDALLSLASDYSYTELEGIDGKMHFRDELLGRLNRVLEGPRIHRVYFTEFVVQ